MAERSRDRSAGGSPANGAAELAQLRELLIGQELAQLDAIQDRLNDPARRSAEIAHILPQAVGKARPKTLREALEPVFEKSFQSAVRKHPKELADAIYPVIGPAIRRSIASAIRDFAEGLNQIIEKSASFRAIRWRVEAKITGKPFSEILLARSLLYSVEQVFLIHRTSGLLLQHVAADGPVLKDADMISGMLTAIQDFFSDSFTGGGQDLETVDAGRFKLWIQYGPKALLAAAVSGSAPPELRTVLRNALDKIHQVLYAELDTFRQDDLSVFEPAHQYLKMCLLGSAPAVRRRRIPFWIVFVAIVLLLSGLVFYRVRVESRWAGFFQAIRQQPGIVVTSIEKRGPGYVIAGLKDPKAPDPSGLLREKGLDPHKVKYEWQPYLSLNTLFARERDRDTAREQTEKQIIRFEMGSSRLPLSEVDRIEAVAAAISRLGPRYRIAVTGHTDEMGSIEANSVLSRERASQVVQALGALGISPAQLQPVAAGNQLPVRAGGTDWDRAANRSVSFRVMNRPE
jgi:outer membrane protein OmpA-like peptidoglycan-associated protein